jgi:ATP-dependent Lhr-like helicase
MGVAGEQFATPEAVERLRQIRDEKPSRDWLVISAADPANLAGIVTAGPRIAATRSNRLVLQAGRLIASYESGDIQFHEAVEPALADRVSRSLRRDGLYRAEVELLCAGTE